MRQPIGVEGHSAIDYAFLPAATVAPVLLGLDGRARVLPIAFGLTQGLINALTDQPFALDRRIPFKLHGRLESVAVPLLAVAVVASGALEQPRAKAYFGALLGALAVVYTLTDWSAQPAR